MLLRRSITHGVKLACVFLLLASVAYAEELFVAPFGNDSNPGSKQAPLATLDGARKVIAARKLAGKQSVNVHVADGVYYLPETLVLTAADSGTADCPIVYRSQTEGGAVLSGGSELKLTWASFRDGIFKAQTPAGLTIDQLFINGKNQRMARYPNYNAAMKAKPYQGFASDAFSKERSENWADP